MTSSATLTGPVWMVDDESELVAGTVHMLAREFPDAQVRGANDPREISEWIDAEKPAALITDVRMPHLSGLELVIKLHKKWGPVPVVVITAFPTAQVDQGANDGVFAYLPKPFSFQSLRETLMRVTQQTASSAFSGAIAVSMLGEVVQLYGLANRSGVLRVLSGALLGDIAFEGGNVVDARVGKTRGVSAFNEILSWNSGGFSWRPGGRHEVTIRTSLSELLMEAYRLRDEREHGMKKPETAAPPDDDALFAELDKAAWSEEVPLARGSDVFEIPKLPKSSSSNSAATNLREHLQRLERLEGFVGAALVDVTTGLCLVKLGGNDALNLDVAGAGNAELIRAKRFAMDQLELQDEIEDILISLGNEYHLIRPLQGHADMFFYLALDRSRANLAMARYSLSNAEKDIVL